MAGMRNGWQFGGTALFTATLISACTSGSSGSPAASTSGSTLTPTATATASGARTASIAEPPPPPLTLIFRIGTQEGNVVFERAPRARDTMISVNMAPNPATSTQPAEIRKGSCAGGGTTAFKLTELQNGQSTTDVQVGRRTLFDGSYSVVVRASDSDSAVIACVNLPTRQDGEGGGPHRNEPKPVPTLRPTPSPT